MGRYYSEELGTTYTIALKDGALIASHRRHGEFALTPTVTDEFSGGPWWFRRVRFERDSSGRVRGFHLTGGRVRNIWFARMP